MSKGPIWLEGTTLDALAALAEQADCAPAWPAESWRLVGELGALGWSLPKEVGGQGLDRVAQLEGSEQLGSAWPASAVVFSQREAAVRWLVQGNVALRQRTLPALARGETFVTVGLSQLTTSRQHRPPSLRALALASGKYQLDGEVPWVTGADRADGIVIGAV